MERRKAVRARSILGGRLVFNHRFWTIDCVVRNLSPDGARLELNGNAALPDQLDLSIPKREETRRVRIVWRSEAAAGVSFVETPTSSGPISFDLARRLRACESENGTLKRHLARMEVDP